MTIITLPLGNHINTSIQVGDMVYYSVLTTVGGSGFPINGAIRQLGVVTNINADSINVIYDETVIPPAELPTLSSYLMFAKDKQVNSSSIIGYYAEVEFKNYSTDKIELFSIGSEITESSK